MNERRQHMVSEGTQSAAVQAASHGARGFAHPNRRNSGFTMMETMIVVGIIAVLAGVAFAGVMQAWKNFQQMELDTTAKEIYAAAQNHLALAESQGLLDSNSGISLGTRESSETPRADDVYYFVYSPDVSASDINNPNTKSSALSLMLPFGSIDETVRTSESYVIRYQPSSGLIMDVFYAKDYDFAASDYARLVSDYRGEVHKADRLDYNGTGKIIGYCGEEDARKSAMKLKAPTLQVTNGDTLSVKVINPSANNALMTRYNSDYGTTDKLQMRLVVEGKTTGAAVWFEQDVAGSATNEFTVSLDDVTKVNGHFYEVVNERDAKYRKAGGGLFIPGEDLLIYAWVSSTGRAVVAKSATSTTNSLFAASLSLSTSPLTPGATALTTMGGVDDDDMNVHAATAFSEYAASIMSFRHLANLSRDVSHFNYEAVENSSGAVTGFSSTATAFDKVVARQTTDLDWSTFATPSSSHANVKIYGSHSVSSAAGTFLPVLADYKLSYNGNNHSVSNLAVNVEGPAGMFARLSINDSKIENLTLVDANVTSTAAEAGALVGKMAGTAEVSNVLARENLESANGGSQITGATAAGGLVGAMEGGTVNASAAAVYVSSTVSGAAGGLVGQATNATLTDSYSGGHTQGGAYLSSTSGNARVNVMSGGNAGGLIGTATGAAISNCYSTCSAQGGVNAGGFVGYAEGSSIGNCYATGLVLGGTIGAFAGNASGVSMSNNWYFGFINDGLGAVANAPASSVAAFDDSVAIYNSFATGAQAAVPYDKMLAQNYAGTYPFKSINALRGAQADSSPLTVHYGDWPSPEALAKNYS